MNYLHKGIMKINIYNRLSKSHHENLVLTLLHSERPKLHRVLAILSATGLRYGVLPILSAIGLRYGVLPILSAVGLRYGVLPILSAIGSR